MIRTERTDALLTVVLSRPDAANALTPAMLGELDAVLNDVGKSPDIRVVILRGEGGRMFSAGYDIASIPEGATEFEPEKVMDSSIESIEGCPKPVIAMIEGHCVGFACDLALACDLRIAARNARFAIPPARLGNVYPLPGMQRLLRTMGRSGVQELLLTGQSIDVDRALQLGMVQRVVAPENLLEETRKVARLIANSAPLALAATKAIVRELSRSAEGEHLSSLQLLVDKVRASRDAVEGKRAFLEKRTPKFAGE